MKNILLGLLVLAVGVMGLLLFSDRDTNDNTTSSNSSSSNTDGEKPSVTSGKTIDLANKGLSKISTDILDDSSVTTLDVSGNNLTGSLPGEIRKLTNLEVLNASDNKMTGIPAEIGQLSKLRTANFANNGLSGLPNEIGNLSNLETLDLRGNPKVSRSDVSKIQSKIPNAKILVD